MSKVVATRTRGAPRAAEKVDPPPGAGRRERQKLDKRDRIQRAAWELFASVGYDATTTKQVAARADVASGTLFLYARDKEDLLCLVMHDRIAAAVDARFETLPRAAPLLDQLMHVFRGVFLMYGEHPAVAAAFVRVFPGADGPNGQRVGALTFAFLHRLAGLVHERQARGEIAADVEPLRAASNVFWLYYGALMSWISGYISLEAALDPGLRGALALQIRGLGA
jgi:TetR/AcrR family transcriptional regulator, cholesterol catabolism regulator